MRKKKKSVKSAINQALTCKMAKNSLRKTANRCCYYCYNIVIVLVLIVSNFQIQCGPSAQQEQELLLLDALSRKQSLNSNLNAISTSNNNNYETNTIMDMLGRSMLLILLLCVMNFGSVKILQKNLFKIFRKKTHISMSLKKNQNFSLSLSLNDSHSSICY